MIDSDAIEEGTDFVSAANLATLTVDGAANELSADDDDLDTGCDWIFVAPDTLCPPMVH